MIVAELTAADCERIFHAALTAGRERGVEAALTLLAVRDPHRAQTLLDVTQWALDFAKAGSDRAGSTGKAESDGPQRS